MFACKGGGGGGDFTDDHYQSIVVVRKITTFTDWWTHLIEVVHSLECFFVCNSRLFVPSLLLLSHDDSCAGCALFRDERLQH